MSAHAIMVPCPNCQAPAFRPCTAPTDTGRRPIVTLHLARIVAASSSGEGSGESLR